MRPLDSPAEIELRGNERPARPASRRGLARPVGVGVGVGVGADADGGGGDVRGASDAFFI
jgi:hypothetical protein